MTAELLQCTGAPLLTFHFTLQLRKRNKMLLPTSKYKNEQCREHVEWDAFVLNKIRYNHFSSSFIGEMYYLVTKGEKTWWVSGEWAFLSSHLSSNLPLSNAKNSTPLWLSVPEIFAKIVSDFILAKNIGSANNFWVPIVADLSVNAWEKRQLPSPFEQDYSWMI